MSFSSEVYLNSYKNAMYSVFIVWNVIMLQLT